jgi:hypothetical protein
MPDVKIYIREVAWANLLRECKHDQKAAKREIAEMVNRKYGQA